jgi:hypothetical protein
LVESDMRGALGFQCDFFKDLVPSPEAEDRRQQAKPGSHGHHCPENDVLLPDACVYRSVVARGPAVSAEKSNDQRNYEPGNEDGEE